MDTPKVEAEMPSRTVPAESVPKSRREIVYNRICELVVQKYLVQT